MANEISFSVSVVVRNGTFGLNFGKSGQLTQIGVGSQEGVMAVPTTAGGTVFALGSVTTEGLLMLTNCDATNYVDYGPNNAGAILAGFRILPGETHILRIKPGVTLRLLANTATVNVENHLLQA